LRHIHSRWDPNTRQVFSEEEAELEELLADDDEMNKSDEPSLKRNSSSPEINIPTGAFLSEDPVIYQDDDSVSTFNTAQHSIRIQPSVRFTLKVIPTTQATTSTSVNIPIDIDSEQENVSKFSDTSIEDKFEAFQSSLLEIKTQTALEAKKNASTLADILTLLERYSVTFASSNLEQVAPFDRANHLNQMLDAGGTCGAAGSGS